MATTSPTCPHGSLGDFSCDGYLRITRTVFACYAPKSIRTRPTVVVQKIRSDHTGALEHWKAMMSEWRIVHNDDDGLPPNLVQLLDALRQVDEEIAVGDWNLDDVRGIVQRLHRDHLVDLF